MRFDVSDLLQGDPGASQTFEVRGDCAVSDEETREVTGAIEVMRTNLGVLVRAHLGLVEQESCSRCLRPLIEAVPIEFEEEYREEADLRQVDPDEAADMFVLDNEGVFDLTEAVRQYRETALAMQPLCRPDCKGLCPACGSDLNDGPCDCGAGKDSRWSALAALRGVVADGRD